MRCESSVTPNYLNSFLQFRIILGADLLSWSLFFFVNITVFVLLAFIFSPYLSKSLQTVDLDIVF